MDDRRECVDEYGFKPDTEFANLVRGLVLGAIVDAGNSSDISFGEISRPVMLESATIGQ